MRKKLLIHLALAIPFSLFLYCCEEVEPPTGDFLVSQEDINENIKITFTDLSSNNPKKWNWTFEGGIPEKSTEQNPTVLYTQPGVYDVTLEVSNDGGSDWIFKTDYVHIARFTNNMPSEAEVTIGNQTKLLPSNSQLHFARFDENSVSSYIETSGKDLNGEQTGILLYWDLRIDFSEYYYYILDLPSELIFFNMTNNSNTNITHFLVNYRDPDFESFEEVIIPNDRMKYGIGYYFANNDMEIRAYSPGGYTNWIDGEDFDIPWTINQFVDLSFNTNVKTQKDPEPNITTDKNILSVPLEKVKVVPVTGYKKCK